ncbi:hypothetical protein ACOALA_13735 [Alicyclobacillus acidoterrestris]|uniref:hypothetical protein n=1 Tax=Alicyclobacillus TaxID=29330 RepID=UPI001A8F11C3|nr:hypothetical protein [Alicyclobacillus suci]
MSIKIVAYDLHFGTEDVYTELIEKIEGLTDSSIEIEKSVWLVWSDDNTATLKSLLKPFIGKEDKLFIAELQGGVSWSGITGIKKFIGTKP